MADFNTLETLMLRVMRRNPAKWWAALEVKDACRKEVPSVRVDQSNLYPTLRGLEARGFLKGREETAEEQEERIRQDGCDFRDGRLRYLYQVSDAGRRVVFKDDSAAEVGGARGLKPVPT